MPPASSPESLLDRARAGDASSQGKLLELYRGYLRLVARALIRGTMRVKLDPSDLVQETFLKAHRDFPSFAGATEPELVAWLRQILVRNLADHVKHHKRKVRDMRRQESLEALLDRSSKEAQQALAARIPSPSASALQRERAVLLAEALEKLPAHYREVFILRTLEHVPIAEIAERMGRSPGAVRMLFARVVERLGRELGERP